MENITNSQPVSQNECTPKTDKSPKTIQELLIRKAAFTACEKKTREKLDSCRTEIARLDTFIAEFEAYIAETDVQAAEFEALSAELDVLITEKETLCFEKDTLITESNARIARKDALIAELDKQIALKKAQIG